MTQVTNQEQDLVLVKVNDPGPEETQAPETTPQLEQRWIEEQGRLDKIRDIPVAELQSEDKALKQR